MLLTPLISAWSWLKKVFVSHTESAAPIAVTITETVKTLLANPVTGFLANLADVVFNTKLPTSVLTGINNAIPKIIATELAIEGLPQNPTPDQILNFENQVIKSFDIKADNSKLYTLIGSQVIGEIQKTLTTTPGKFADWVICLENSYLDYQKDLAANATTGIIDLPVGTKLSNGNIIVEDANQALKETQSPKVPAQ